MYEKYRKKLRFEIFDGRMLTVNGKPEAAIWSAKGKRKISGVFQEAAKRATAGWNGGDRMAKVLSAVQQEKIDPDNLRGAARTLS